MSFQRNTRSARRASTEVPSFARAKHQKEFSLAAMVPAQSAPI
jgi:hypothetical protein